MGLVEHIGGASAVGLALMMAACGSDQKKVQTGPPERGPSKQASAKTRGGAPSTQTALAPEPVRAFQARVAALPERSDSHEHRAHVEALRSLASALESIPAMDESGSSRLRTAVGRVRSAADRLERSPRSSLEHADLVIRALYEAVEAAGEQRAWATRDGFGTALRSARHALESADPATPLLRQRAEVDTAFARLGALLAAASGRAVTPAGPTRREKPTATIAELRELVHRIAGDEEERSRAARADFFATLADYLAERSDSDGIKDATARLHAQAARLRAASSTSFDRPSHLKRGLQAASDGIASLSRELARGGEAEGWLQSLRAAVEAVSAEQMVTFQRAALQDAFRLAVDTLAALELVQRCPAPSG